MRHTAWASGAAFQRALGRSFWLRWLLANIVGWSIGLYAGALTANWLGRIPFMGLLMAGVVTGGIAGAAQRLALRPIDRQQVNDGRWYAFSAAGGVLGALVVFPAAFTLILGRVPAFALLGGLFGLCFGLVQALALDAPAIEIVWWWAGANLLGGCFCGWLALGITPLGLPIFCSGGPLVFGLITGLAWRQILRAEITHA